MKPMSEETFLALMGKLGFGSDGAKAPDRITPDPKVPARPMQCLGCQEAHDAINEALTKIRPAINREHFAATLLAFAIAEGFAVFPEISFPGKARHMVGMFETVMGKLAIQDGIEVRQQVRARLESGENLESILPDYFEEEADLARAREVFGAEPSWAKGLDTSKGN